MLRSLAFGSWLFGLAAPVALAQDTIRVSVDSKGNEGDGDSILARGLVATAGSQPLVVFSSNATNLVAHDGNGKYDVFLRDLATGTTTRLSLDLTGGDPDGDSFAARMTPDGAFVIFQSIATDLVKGDKNGQQDVFLLDRTMSSIERVSLDEAGKELDEDSFASAISDDGRYVVFSSFAAAVAADGNTMTDVFVRDRVAGTTVCASLSPAGTTGNDASDVATLSADGRTLAFSSLATDLVPGDTNGARDVFVRDLAAGTTTRASVNDGGFEADAVCSSPTISSDGRLVAFHTAATNLHRDAANGFNQILVRDLATGETWLASRGVDGLAADGHCSGALLFEHADAAGSHWLVAFGSSATNLFDDGGADRDLFVADFVAGVGQCVSVDSDGNDDGDIHSTASLGASADGSTLVFTTNGDELVPGDTNGAADVFLRGLQWTRPLEFGVGLAGTGGHVPHLGGGGGSCEAGRWSIAITDGLGSAPGHLWVGFGRTSGVPLFGGTFYVDFAPVILPLPIVLDGPAGLAGAGELFLDGVNVEGLGEFSIYLQCLLLDAHALRGVSFSNALELAIDA